MMIVVHQVLLKAFGLTASQLDGTVKSNDDVADGTDEEEVAEEREPGKPKASGSKKL